MKILALEHEKPGSEAGQFAPFLKSEAVRVWELYRAGVIRELYFRADRHEAVLVLECESVEAARDVLADLPLVAADLIEFELVPLESYSGFERLFADKP